ncbi:peptidoglycan DD-metalloendopeptidase family protein [Dokdonia ponticola]|uniref:Peptidoglycan DD-metalloendopeptidase family protein n=1 Tax=Dokdonia ponticola TaxID=2041041 RepID=A0ABV9HWI1_9FLAO
MKLILRVSILSYMLLTFGVSMAQVVGGESVFNPEGIECVSEEDYALYHAAVAQNQAMLTQQGLRLYQNDISNFSEQQVSFAWPVQQADGFEYNSTWGISVYFDHDETTGGLQDWNCGTRTYDTSSGYNHQGVDIFLWPFSWKQVEESQTEIIAAAPGQIIFKNDGSFDRNCSFNNQQWNAIFIEHSDGSIAWYGHMKNGSVTSKNVGDTVAQGEYLGVVASSGNSTGPHLHFEVYDENNSLIDPYAGPCNDLNDTSWWADQKEYLNSGVNAALTHTNLPNFGTCPSIEETFESTQFDVGATIWFIGYYKDQVTGTSSLNQIFDPSGNLYSSWNTNFTDDFVASWWGQQRTITDQTGEWIYVVTYNGESHTHTFNVGQLSVEDQLFDEVRVFPNPTSGIVTIGAPVAFKQIVVRDALGRTVLEYLDLNSISIEMDFSSLTTGIYFVTVQGLDADTQTTVRVLKK